MDKNGQYKINFPPERDDEGQGFLDLNFNKKEKEEKKKRPTKNKKKIEDSQTSIDFEEAERKAKEKRDEERLKQLQKSREEDKEDREALYYREPPVKHNVIETDEFKEKARIVQEADMILGGMKFSLRKKLLSALEMSDKIEDNEKNFKNYQEAMKRLELVKSSDFKHYLLLVSLLNSHKSLGALERKLSVDNLKQISKKVEEIKNKDTSSSANIKSLSGFKKLLDLLDNL